MRERLRNARTPLRSTLAAIVDQAVVSGTNFATVLLLARAVSPDELGAFALVLAVGLLLTNTQSAVVTQPLSVLGVAREGEEFDVYISTSFRLQLTLTIITSSLVAALCTMLQTASDARFVTLVLMAVPFFACWQLQEFVRRVLFAQERVRAALANDLVTYGGQTLVLAVLLASGKLSAPIALAVAATTSGLGVLVGLGQVGQLLRRAGSLRMLWRENWSFGRWLVLANAMQAASTRLYIYLSAALLGVAATGVLQAVSQISNVLNVFMFALMSTLMPRFGRAFAREGGAALHRMTVGWTVATTVGATAVIALPLVAPVFSLNLLYGDRYKDYGTLMQMQSILAVMWVPTYVPSLAIRVYRANWAFPVLQGLNIVLTLTLGSYLLREHGLEGSMVGSGVGAVLSLALLVWVYRRARHSEPAPDAAGSELR